MACVHPLFVKLFHLSHPLESRSTINLTMAWETAVFPSNIFYLGLLWP